MYSLVRENAIPPIPSEIEGTAEPGRFERLSEPTGHREYKLGPSDPKPAVENDSQLYTISVTVSKVRYA